MTRYEDTARELAEAATPGPWAKAQHGQERGGGGTWWSVNRAHNDGRVLQVWQGRQVARVMSALHGSADAALIAAHSPDVVRALAEVVGAARAVLADFPQHDPKTCVGRGSCCALANSLARLDAATGGGR